MSKFFGLCEDSMRKKREVQRAAWEAATAAATAAA